MNNILTIDEIDKIHRTCNSWGVLKYTINSDGSIDVDGDCKLKSIYSPEVTTEIPLQFNKVSGSFGTIDIKLTSLRGCPKYVGGDFACNNCSLTSLEYGPVEVGGNFNCGINLLISLEGCPTKVGGNFNCYMNSLSTLDFVPSDVGGIYDLDYNAYPPDFHKELHRIDDDLVTVVIKYHTYYDVWSPEFNSANLAILIKDT
jgi:hypothetical protein